MNALAQWRSHGYRNLFTCNSGEGARRCGTNTLTSTKKVFEDVLTERRYQDRQWGHGVDDTKNTPWMWTAYVCSYATKWMKDPFRFKREDTNEFYDRMIETAAIAAAACESVLRQRDMNGKTFYEPD